MKTEEIKMEGFYKNTPSIKKLSFIEKGKMSIILTDGRVISVPLKYFPSIKKLSTIQRRYYTIIGDEGIMFKYSDFVYHIQDFFGKEQNYRYAGTFSKKEKAELAM
ncbi:MAG: hypothetical protein A3H98_04635 [Bacteroidetes bacterium RIFCSPLOWO2_02_FULL_36_8]|nr:MAG: hypothetical protein A3H98_04635 [Bacteroidetes bacterium RIFCSPLOWO2_02_FULL_36_8]OFY70657.1 MAG: hypothetical protein A3G23_07970 [Bacteroidetes bacterium RIFCSPLOWO2_12_FULL_37_12]